MTHMTHSLRSLLAHATLGACLVGLAAPAEAGGGRSRAAAPAPQAQETEAQSQETEAQSQETEAQSQETEAQSQETEAAMEPVRSKLVVEDRLRRARYPGQITITPQGDGAFEIVTELRPPHGQKDRAKKVGILFSRVTGHWQPNGSILAKLEPKRGMRHTFAPTELGNPATLTVFVDREQQRVQASWRDLEGNEVRSAKTPAPDKELTEVTDHDIDLDQAQDLEKPPADGDGLGAGPAVSEYAQQVEDSQSQETEISQSQEPEPLQSQEPELIQRQEPEPVQAQEIELAQTQELEAQAQEPEQVGFFTKIGRAIKSFFSSLFSFFR